MKARPDPDEGSDEEGTEVALPLGSRAAPPAGMPATSARGTATPGRARPASDLLHDLELADDLDQLQALYRRAYARGWAEGHAEAQEAERSRQTRRERLLRMIFG